MARRLLATYLTITALTLAVVVVPLGRVFADREQSRLTFDIERDAQAVASLVEDDLEAGTAPVHRRDARRLPRHRRAHRRRRHRRGERRRLRHPRRRAARLLHPPGDRRRARRAAQRAAPAPRRRSARDLLYVAVPVASGGQCPRRRPDHLPDLDGGRPGPVDVAAPRAPVGRRPRARRRRRGDVRHAASPVRCAASSAPRARLAAGDLGGARRRRRRPTGAPRPRRRRSTPPPSSSPSSSSPSTDSWPTPPTSCAHRSPRCASGSRPSPPTSPSPPARSSTPRIAETNRLGRLVHSLLVLARSDADRGRTRRRRPDRTRSPTGSTPGRRSPPTRQYGSPSTAPPDLWVLALPGAVEQILDNLISNALDAVPDDTEILVRADVAGDTVDLHVIDQGPGMDPDAREPRVRTVLAANRRPSDRNGTGFGLGLAIVAQLAARSGGRGAPRTRT